MTIRRILPAALQAFTPPAAGALCLAAALLLFPAQANAEEPVLYFAPSYWIASLSGNGQTGEGRASQQFDLIDTLGLDGSDSVPSLEFFIVLGKSRVMLGWNRGAYEGSRRLDQTLDFDGFSFPTGEKLHSDLDYDRKRLFYGRNFVERRLVNVGVLVGLETYRAGTDVRVKGIGSRDVALRATIPVVGVYFSWNPNRLIRVYVEAEGMRINRGGIQSTLTEGWATAEWLVLGKYVALSTGYRWSFVRGDDEDDVRMTLRQKGLFTGFVVRF